MPHHGLATRFARGLAMAAGAALLAGCGNAGSNNQQAGGKDYLIGFVGTTSGPNAPVGKPHQDGASAYFDQLNKAGGINGRKVKFITTDDKGAADQAIANVRDLQSQGVSAILGPAFANQMVAAAPTCQQLKVSCVSGGVPRPLVIPPMQYVFSNDILPAAESFVQLDFLASLGLSSNARIGFAAVNTANGQDAQATMHDAIKEHPGWTIVSEQLIPTSVSDVAAVVAKLRDSKPDGVVLGSTDPVSILMLNQMAALGMNVPVINYHGGSAVSTLKAINNPNFYVVKEFAPATDDNPNVKKMNAAAAADGFADEALGSFGFAQYYVSGAIVADALKHCPADCSASDFSKAMLKVNLNLPGLIWAPITFTATKTQGVTAAKVYHLDKKDGQVLAANNSVYTHVFK